MIRWLTGYSPYQKLVKGKTYPAPFFLTSTKDDRVHPAHGRKAAARMAATKGAFDAGKRDLDTENATLVRCAACATLGSSALYLGHL